MERKGGYAHERGAPRGVPGDAERMSGVLDRMAQRSRGSLPAIEPLVRAQQTAAAALPFVAEDNASPAPRRRNAAVAGQERALRDQPEVAARDVRRDTAQARDAIRKDSPRSEALELAGVKRAADSDERVVGNDAGGDGLTAAGLERDVAKKGEVRPHESSIEMRAEKMSANPEETTGESFQMKARVEKRAATLDISAVRNETGEAAPAVDAAEHTEIHITIGSVELRAPRVAPAPLKAPAFRPRVTLDEFLKRGVGSGGSGARS
jgi:hypothetical protein